MLDRISRFLGIWAVVGFVVFLGLLLAGSFGLALYMAMVGRETTALLLALLTVVLWVSIMSAWSGHK